MKTRHAHSKTRQKAGTPPILLMLVLFNVGLIACGPHEEAITEQKEPTEPMSPPSLPTEAPRSSKKQIVKLHADAGVPVTLAPQPYPPAEGDLRAISPRMDPFQLLPGEILYRNEKETERIIGEIGGFMPMIGKLPAPKVPPPPVFEPQPDRKFLGLMVSGHITALIKMEDGHVYAVRPGAKIPNSEWTLVYVDNTKIILRRGGEKLPKEVTIPLEGSTSQIENNTSSNFGGASENFKIQPSLTHHRRRR